MTVECQGLDTPTTICFYEQDFYVFSNFSSFEVGIFKTAEHRYHWEKFQLDSDFESDDVMAMTNYELAQKVADLIMDARSAHDAFQIAQEYKAFRRADWDDLKVNIMRTIIRQKVDEHAYVKRKLLASGDRRLVENSWRDDFWGWGPNRDGQNILGKLWMELRQIINDEMVEPERLVA